MQEQTFHPPENGDVDKGWTLLAVCWALVLCAFITTALRVIVRLRLTKNFGFDDFCMIVAMCTTFVGAGLITTEVVHGLGRHMFYLTSEQRRIFRVVGWVDWIQTFITLGLTKLSICLFLMRIVDSRKIRAFTWLFIAFLVLFTLVFIIFFLVICRPLKAYWDVGVYGTCFSDIQIRNIVIAQGAFSIFTDLVLSAYPIVFLRDLQIKPRTKIALYILMGLGVITAACCTVRTALSGAMTDTDVTWAIVANVGWRLPEVNIGIVCANAPVLRPLYLYYRGELRSQRTSSAGLSKERVLSSKEHALSSNKDRLEDGASPLKLYGNPWGETTTHIRASEASVELGLPLQQEKM